MAVKFIDSGRVDFVGAVVETDVYSRGLHTDNWVARVWTESGLKTILLRTQPDEYDGTTYAVATADATPEVMAAVVSWTQAECAALSEKANREAAEREERRVSKGKNIKVVKGRKVRIGTSGTCIWVGQGTYGMRVGLKDDAGTVHWTALDNVVVSRWG